MDSIELRVLQRQTKHFIDDNPSLIGLMRPNKTPDGRGGFTHGTPTPLGTQVVRMVTIPAGTDGIVKRNIDGTLVQPDYVMIGETTLDVQRGDSFTYHGHEHTVLYVRPEHLYETWAEVRRDGG